MIFIKLFTSAAKYATHVVSKPRHPATKKRVYQRHEPKQGKFREAVEN